MTTEQIVYLLRKTNLSLSEIGKLTPAQFNEILKEVYFQESVESYRQQYSVANILAAIYNTIPRKRGATSCKAGDFLKGGMPQRQSQVDSIEKLAEERGLRLPSNELKTRG